MDFAQGTHNVHLMNTTLSNVAGTLTAYGYLTDFGFKSK